MILLGLNLLYYQYGICDGFIGTNDFYGKWYQTEIIEIYQDKIKVHFPDWDMSYDEIININSDRLSSNELTLKYKMKG